MSKEDEKAEVNLEVMKNFLKHTKDGKYFPINMNFTQYPRVEEENVEDDEECYYLLGIRKYSF
jgi:hypothetical protein